MNNQSRHPLFLITLLLTIVFTLPSCLDDFEVNDVDNTVYEDAPENVSSAKVLSLVNDYRANGCNCGGTHYPPVPEVHWNSKLAKAALDHSVDMHNNNYFSHTGLDGSTPGDRIARAGYIWWTVGENIAKGYPSEEAVVQAWIDSPGHCKNIMNGEFREMGLGTSGPYWTQEFGLSRD